ncbi:MAG: LysM peptidoglycan-binding domain-containing protein [Cytophagales bacterium]|nr:LysM peptidoglycan-binding domain-containing protein [Cytophagales bacterium]
MNSKNLILFILLCLGITSAFGSPIDSLGLKKDNNKTYIVYKVENKQPLYSILKHFNLSLTEFKQINPEVNIPINAGEIIFIPIHYLDEATNALIAPVKPAEKVVAKKQEEIKPTESSIHIVSAKQSLLTIANLHKVTMADIRKWNNLTSDVLKEGQRLLVEAPKNFVIDKSTLLGSKNDKGIEELKSDSKESDGLKKTIETGIAELIEVPDNSGKYLALHKSAPIGTLVLVKNLANNQSIWVKVIGRLPNSDGKLIIKLSPKAFERLNAVDKRIRAEISYLIQ